MKKKILHIVLESSFNGATVYAYRLCTKLKEYDQEIIACFNGNAYDEIRLTIDCKNLLSTNEVSYKYLFLKYWKFIKYIRKKNYNVIHYHQGGVGILLLAYLFRKKAIVVHHLHSGNLIGDNTKQDISILHLVILKYLSNKTSQIAIAEHVFNEYSKKIDNTKNVKLIRNSIPYFFEKKIKNSNTIGYIGRFTKEKGLSTLSDISIILKKQFPELKIYTMGDDLSKFANFFSNSPDNIEFINPDLNTRKFYRSIDLLLFLSIAPEGMPLVVLEAISFDVGVIGYPVDGVIEILGKNYPLLVRSEKEAMEMINNFYSNEFDREELSKIHSECSVKFNFDKMINQLKQIYE